MDNIVFKFYFNITDWRIIQLTTVLMDSYFYVGIVGCEKCTKLYYKFNDN